MIAFRGKLCNQAATRVRISLEGNTGKRVSIQAGSIHPALHPRNAREKKQKERRKKPRSPAGAPMRGPEHWERAVMGMTAGSYLVPRARPDRNPTAVDIRRDGCCWMMMSEEDGEREAKKWLRWNWPCAKPARGFPCWCLLSWAGGGGVTGTSPLCAFWPTSLHDIFPNLMRQQRPQTKLQPVNWGVCDLTDLILLQNQETREWFYLKLAETLKENILSSWVFLVLKNFLTLDI